MRLPLYPLKHLTNIFKKKKFNLTFVFSLWLYNHPSRGGLEVEQWSDNISLSASVGSNLRQVWCIDRPRLEIISRYSNSRALGPLGSTIHAIFNPFYNFTIFYQYLILHVLLQRKHLIEDNNCAPVSLARYEKVYLQFEGE